MKLFKLGLLAITLSLVATIIVLDKKNNQNCGCDNHDDSDEIIQDKSSNDIIVEESML